MWEGEATLASQPQERIQPGLANNNHTGHATNMQHRPRTVLAPAEPRLLQQPDEAISPPESHECRGVAQSFLFQN